MDLQNIGSYGLAEYQGLQNQWYTCVCADLQE